MRCAIYVRVSTKDGRQDTRNQLLQLRAHVSEQGWQIARVYQDHASGSKSDRASYQKMLEDAKIHKFDCLLFWSLDRLSRQGVLPTLFALDGLSTLGIAYKSLTEPYLDSCGIFKDAVISILATIAKQERLRISERTKAGLSKQKKQGTVGPNGYSGPGRPAAVFDREQVIKLRTVKNWPIGKIAVHLGVAKSTIHRFLVSENIQNVA